jgi:hypothetical protein
MNDAIQKCYWRANGIVVPLLFVEGIIAALLGMIGLAVGRFTGTTGLLLLAGGIGVTVIALLLELLTEIAKHLAVVRTQLKSLELLTDVAGHLAAMRAQMGKGVLGLLG